MDLIDCRLVINIAKSESLTQGSKDTFLSLPAASLRLKALETSLGMQLFQRRYNGMAPTEAGLCFTEHARAILANASQMHAALQEIRDNGRRLLRIAASSSYVTDFLPALLQDYLHLHPDISIDIQTCKKAETENGILDERIDIGFISSPTGGFPVEAIDLGADPLIMTTAADAPLASLQRIDLRQLAACGHVVLGEQGTLRSYLRERLAEHGMDLNVRVSVADYKTMMDMVAANIGVGVIHQSLAHRYRHRGIRQVPIDAQWTLHRRYALVSERARAMPSVDDFLSYVVARWRTDTSAPAFLPAD